MRYRSGALAVTALLALPLAGCAANVQTVGAVSVAAAPRGASIAFESIDGPPPAVFRKLVQDLEAEADARQVAVVSREGVAQYRVRGYLAAQVERREAAFLWAWDVYDAEQHRALRISGQEKAGPAGRDAWAAADDQLLRRIARAGMKELAAFLAAPPRAPAVPQPDAGGQTVGAMEDEVAPDAVVAANPPRARPALAGPALASRGGGTLAFQP